MPTTDEKDREQLEDICEILRGHGRRIGLEDLRPIVIKGTVYFFPELPAEE